MSETKIYLEFSMECQQVLDENEIRIQEIIHNENIKAEVRNEIIPYQTEKGARTRDLVPVILASGAAITGISLAISYLLGTILNTFLGFSPKALINKHSKRMSSGQFY